MNQLKLDGVAPHRTITVVFEIHNSEEANPIWDSYRDNSAILGSRITSISNGNILDELEEYFNQMDGRRGSFDDSEEGSS